MEAVAARSSGTLQRGGGAPVVRGRGWRDEQADDDENLESPRQPGYEVRWRFSVRNASNRTFHGLQILVQYRDSADRPRIADILSIQKEAIGNAYLPDGFNVDLLDVDRIRPGETSKVNTLPTEGVRLAWLRVPDQSTWRRRPKYRMVEESPRT